MGCHLPHENWMARINNQLAWNINIYHNARNPSTCVAGTLKKNNLKSSTTYWFNSLTTICSTHKQQICQQGPTYIARHRQHWAQRTREKGSETVSSQQNVFSLCFSAWSCLSSLPAERGGLVHTINGAWTPPDFCICHLGVVQEWGCGLFGVRKGLLIHQNGREKKKTLMVQY